MKSETKKLTESHKKQISKSVKTSWMTGTKKDGTPRAGPKKIVGEDAMREAIAERFKKYDSGIRRFNVVLTPELGEKVDLILEKRGCTKRELFSEMVNNYDL